VPKFVVILQHDELSEVATVIVAPLHSDLAAEARPRLHPRIPLPQGEAALAVERMAGISRKEIGAVVGTAREQADAIKRAFDIAFFGF
jgi:hypothetical protein